MNATKNVRSWLRAVYQYCFGNNGKWGSWPFYLVSGKAEAETADERAEAPQSLSGFFRKLDPDLRKPSAEDQNTLSRIKELEARRRKVTEQHTKYALLIQRELYSNGVDRPGKSFTPPEKQVNNQTKNNG